NRRPDKAQPPSGAKRHLIHGYCPAALRLRGPTDHMPGVARMRRKPKSGATAALNACIKPQHPS
ncbi:hypothetical protein, partial [Klebsiella aerogenes]|uniref:hypothetical protein n=1 Tax=Klebsiella aerogenes TaxID=548 RepID=UPI003DA96C94